MSASSTRSSSLSAAERPFESEPCMSVNGRVNSKKFTSPPSESQNLLRRRHRLNRPLHTPRNLLCAVLPSWLANGRAQPWHTQRNPPEPALPAIRRYLKQIKGTQIFRKGVQSLRRVCIRPYCILTSRGVQSGGSGQDESIRSRPALSAVNERPYSPETALNRSASLREARARPALPDAPATKVCSVSLIFAADSNCYGCL
jgi:hypothetical protein